jgi:hypothetical protein
MKFDSPHWEVSPKSVNVFQFWLKQYKTTVQLLKDPYAFLRAISHNSVHIYQAENWFDQKF